jgi:hypothetical protein
LASTKAKRTKEKNLFVVKETPLLFGDCVSICLPSIAPLRLENCHSEQNHSALFLNSTSVGFGNSVGDNLFQIASQVDMIIECTFEGAIL